MHEPYDAETLVELYDFFLNAPIAYQLLDGDGLVRQANDADSRLSLDDFHEGIRIERVPRHVNST